MLIIEYIVLQSLKLFNKMMRCTKQKSLPGRIKIHQEKYRQLQNLDQDNCKFSKTNKA